MTVSWKSLEGTALGADFQLQNLLFEKESIACFQARRPDRRASGWLWLMLAGGSGEILQRLWETAAGLSHPNLVRAFETGHTGREGEPMVYLLTEPAEEDLAAVLRDRPLDQVEARETLLSVGKALSYLHARGLVHGRVEPAAILAVGGDIKLAIDSIAPSVETGGVLSAADDLRALGASLHTMFTRNPEPDLERLYTIPQPFRDIIRGCCGVADEPWTAQRVLAALEWAPEAPAPAAKIPEPEPEPPPPPPPPAKGTHIPAWAFASAVTVTALLFAALVRKPQPAVPAAPPPAAPPATAAQPPALPSALGPPAKKTSPESSDLASSRIWRVVTYTYSNADAATRMVREINRRWPQLRAEQFFPRGSDPPYYVALGGRMTRNEARRLRQRAISAGLPRDTFVRNFSK